MTARNTVLPHDTDIRLAIDEFICSHTVNRNLQQLLENDDAYKKLYTKIFGGLSITSYMEKASSSSKPNLYDAGTIVWYYLQDEAKIKEGFAKLWLLQSVKDNNTDNPIQAFDSLNEFGQPDFEKYGWYDLNEHIDIFAKQFKLEHLLQVKINEEISQHQADISKHAFGKLSASKTSSDYIGRKLLNKTLSNIRDDRQHGFFPYQTGHFTTQSIVNGTYRIWDCGLLELNVVFRLGYTGDDSGYDLLSCNNIRFQQTPTKLMSSKDYQENTKYFYSIDDMKMFQNADNQKTYESIVGDMKQGNRNNYVNTYFAKLEFPRIDFKTETVYGFSDLNYMTFSTGMLSQDKSSSHKTMCYSANQLTFCDKTRNSIIAMLITYPDSSQKDFGSAGGLAANSFSCSIVGKWK